MSDDDDDKLRVQLAAVVNAHTAVGRIGEVRCYCGNGIAYGTFSAHALHVACAVLANVDTDALRRLR